MSAPLFNPRILGELPSLSDSPKEWQQEYVGAFSKQLDPEHYLWIWYYATTELFDAQICRYKDKNGLSIPVTEKERALSFGSAKRCMGIVDRAACLLGIRREVLRDSRDVGKIFRDRDHVDLLLKSIPDSVARAISYATPQEPERTSSIAQFHPFD